MDTLATLYLLRMSCGMNQERGSTKRAVLVVDDNPDIREMLCEVIESEPGCVAYAAEHGRQALEILAGLPAPPCLILVDLMMPIMDGRDLVEALSCNDGYREVPVTVITAAVDRAPETSGGVLRKPFTAEALQELLRTHCTASCAAEPSMVGSRLATMLRDRQDELVHEWISRVREDPAIPQAHNLDEEQLRDNVPMIVEALIASLSQRAQQTDEKGESAHQIGGEEAARAHAKHRRKDRYSLAEELRELHHLRDVFIDLCAHTGLVLRGEEAKLVHGVIDEVMTTAALEMETMSSSDLRRDIELRELFIAILGHDLRTPLTSVVLASSKLLLREDFADAVKKDLRRITSSAARMQRLIEDLLDMARINSGGIPIVRTATDLRLLSEQVIDTAMMAYPQSTILLGSPEAVEGDWDPERLTQLVQNLVSNAVEHGERGAPIRIELRAQADLVEIEVHNRGVPIPPEVLPSIFDPFIQGQPAARRSKGLGLGLFIARTIAEAQGGTLRATSDAEQGTSFIATLPRAA
jgi:signal transduction histidine kinase/CheY-like chemotaxis protein